MFSVIIATCGRPERLRVALESVRRAAAPVGGCRVIVVDNHPDYAAEAIVNEFAGDRPALTCRSGVSETGEEVLQTGARAAGSVEALKERASDRAATHLESRIPNPDFTYLRSTPFNKARALNVGIAAAETEWLAFTDDDTLPDHDWLLNGKACLEREGWRVMGGRVIPGDAPPSLPQWLRVGRSGLIPEIGVHVRYEPLPVTGVIGSRSAVPYGANMFAHRGVFDKYRGYDEELWSLCENMWALGCEDSEFGHRLKLGGETIGYCREALVVHPVNLDRARIGLHLWRAYCDGWRQPMIFTEEERPVLEWFRVRGVVRHIGMGVRDAFAGDSAGAVHHYVEMARLAGSVIGRWSRGYRAYRKVRKLA